MAHLCPWQVMTYIWLLDCCLNAVQWLFTIIAVARICMVQSLIRRFYCSCCSSTLIWTLKPCILWQCCISVIDVTDVWVDLRRTHTTLWTLSHLMTARFGMCVLPYDFALAYLQQVQSQFGPKVWHSNHSCTCFMYIYMAWHSGSNMYMLNSHIALVVASEVQTPLSWPQEQSLSHYSRTP